jgi:hypothetical protein
MRLKCAELAHAQLVEDLARLGIAPVVDLGRLILVPGSGAPRANPAVHSMFCRLAIRLSRPKSATNHGTPAAGDPLPVGEIVRVQRRAAMSSHRLSIEA